MKNLKFPLRQLPAPFPLYQGMSNVDHLRHTAFICASQGGRLVSLWGSDNRDRKQGFSVFTAFSFAAGLIVVEHAMQSEKTACPSIGDIFPYASRMERAVCDLLGISFAGSDQRPWLRHGNWPEFPLRHDSLQDFQVSTDRYPFVQVEGEGVHEIAVGPVHAGTIEPGHFRFQVVGEKVLRLEERLGYKHRGMEKRFVSMDATAAVRLAARVSGDSAVAYSWAYSMAVECLCSEVVSARALALRALLLERERILNHLGDLGALGNDAGLAFALAQFSILKEDMLRAQQQIYGSRYLMDEIVPGGLRKDLQPAEIDILYEQCDAIERQVKNLRVIFADHSGLQDRFLGCGTVEPELAAKLGLTGVAGRASRIASDLRENFPYPPYDALDVEIATHSRGDVVARAEVRFDEIFESIRLIRKIVETLPDGEVFTAMTPRDGFGVGWVEGWRGEIFFALEIENGKIRRAHPHDPSWQNWPVLEHAIIGNIVPDFPLINKSFNLSYSGHDL